MMRPLRRRFSSCVLPLITLAYTPSFYRYAAAAIRHHAADVAAFLDARFSAAVIISCRRYAITPDAMPMREVLRYRRDDARRHIATRFFAAAIDIFIAILQDDVTPPTPLRVSRRLRAMFFHARCERRAPCCLCRRRHMRAVRCVRCHSAPIAHPAPALLRQ